MPDDPVPGTESTGSKPQATTSATEGTTGAASTATPAAAVTSTATNDDPIMGAAQAAGGLAPWKKGARWEVVAAQGAILAVAGLIIWLAPGFGASAALQLMAVLILAMALLSTWRILRGRVAPARMATVAFRAGVGVTVGLITVIGTLMVENRDTGTVALAIVLGIGLVLYGLVALITTFAYREAGSGIPVVALIVSALTVIVGLLLVLNARNGIDSLQGTFTLLGILMLLAGLGFLGYGFTLRSSQMPPAAEE